MFDEMRIRDKKSGELRYVVADGAIRELPEHEFEDNGAGVCRRCGRTEGDVNHGRK